jgi:uncharacterized cupredoxin-like copper-binding protein
MLCAGALALSACSSPVVSTGGMMGGGAAGMGGNGSYQYADTSCPTPTALPGTTVHVVLADMGMSRMMSGTAPRDAHMMLRSDLVSVPAGKVTLVASNRGFRIHELVILPLAEGAQAGQLVVGAGGKVDETGSLGEASAGCGEGTGEGIPSGGASWVTLTLAPGRYELICNMENHYADGMHQELDVT